jgi:hypothetical protein
MPVEVLVGFLSPSRPTRPQLVPSTPHATLLQPQLPTEPLWDVTPCSLIGRHCCMHNYDGRVVLPDYTASQPGESTHYKQVMPLVKEDKICRTCSMHRRRVCKSSVGSHCLGDISVVLFSMALSAPSGPWPLIQFCNHSFTDGGTPWASVQLVAHKRRWEGNSA